MSTTYPDEPYEGVDPTDLAALNRLRSAARRGDVRAVATLGQIEQDKHTAAYLAGQVQRAEAAVVRKQRKDAQGLQTVSGVQARLRAAREAKELARARQEDQS